MTEPASEASQLSPGPTGATPGAATVDEGVRLASAGRLAEAAACFERVLAANPRNGDACNNLGVVRMQSGDTEGAVAMFERALSINPLDRQIRNNCVQATFVQARDLTSSGMPPKSIVGYRRVLALDPDNIGARMNLTNALARIGAHAEPGDFMADAKATLGNHALIACMPKSGSSLLFEALHRLTGWDKAFFAYAYLQNEQELHLPYVRAAAGTNTVTQQHCRATDANIQIIQGFGIRPVVLVRNLADIVVSLADFYDRGASINSFLGADWPNLSPAAKRDCIIDHVMPWYVGFYASWRRAQAAGKLDCLFVAYEQMIADKPGTLQGIVAFLGLERTVEDCRAAVSGAESDKAATRFNRGVAGRGKAALNDEQHARLRRLAVPYASIDFGLIGL